MKITLIVAHDQNKAIGKAGQLPWHLPNDLKWFKKNTLNKLIVMGRTTWEGLQLQPLPRRINLVMTTKQNYTARGAVVCHSMQEVFTIAMAKNCQELMITGGGEIYKLFYPLADEMIITEVATAISKPDAYFVDYKPKHWYESFEEPHPKDENHAFAYSFKIYKRLIKSE